MSARVKPKRELSMSTRSAKSKTRKTPTTQSARDERLIGSGQEEVVSAPSHSRLIEIYQAEEFKRAWANDVPYQVAMNILQLRRHREMTQKQVADEAQTSQSAIARIESDGGNIKLATLQRIIESLKGRLHLSITPEEFAIPPVRPWWESMAQTSETSLPTLAVAVRKAMASKTLSATEAGWVDAANTSRHFLRGVINGTKKT